MSRRWLALLGVAWLVGEGAAAAQPEVGPAGDAPLEIVLVGSPAVRAMLREAVGPLLPDRERIVWIDGGEEADVLDDTVALPRRPRIRIEVPESGNARVTAYPVQGAPTERSIDGAQPASLTIEIVAQIARETAHALLAGANPAGAASAEARATAVSPAPVVVASAPVAATEGASFAIGVAYVQRMIFNPGSLPQVSTPWEIGVSGSLSAFLPMGDFRLSAWLMGDYTQASAGPREALTIDGADPPFSLYLRRYAALAMVGVGFRPHALVQVDLAAGGGAEKVTHGGSGWYEATERYGIGRAMLRAAVAIPPRSWGVEIVAALTVDRRAAQTFSQLFLISGTVSSYTPRNFKTNELQPGFTLGLAWHR